MFSNYFINKRLLFIHYISITILSLVFISAGLSKITSLDFFVEKVKYLPLFLKYEETAVYSLALILALMEMSVGICVWLKSLRFIMLSLMIILLLFFICFTIYLNLLGVLTACPCFIFLKERVMNWQVIVQNSFLALLGVASILTEEA